MPTEKFKFSPKNGVTPVIKKLYNTHKKLLGKSEKGASFKANSKKEYVTRKQSPSEQTGCEIEFYVETDLMGRSHGVESNDTSNHTYENFYVDRRELDGEGALLFSDDSFSAEVFADVNISLSSRNKASPEKSPSNISYIEIKREEDSPIGANTKIIDVTSKTNHETLDSVDVAGNNVTVIEVDATNNDKLQVVIDNFDKIIHEYTSPKQASKPKLQKSKTCSIIESKCILKKTFSEPFSEETFRSLELPSKTKSLYNLDCDVSTHYTNWVSQNKGTKAFGAYGFWYSENQRSLNLKLKTQPHQPSKDLIDTKPKSAVDTQNHRQIYVGSLEKLHRGNIETVNPNSVSVEGQPSVKVKEVVKKLNSLLSDNDDVDKPVAPVRKKQSKQAAILKMQQQNAMSSSTVDGNNVKRTLQKSNSDSSKLSKDIAQKIAQDVNDAVANSSDINVEFTEENTSGGSLLKKSVKTDESIQNVKVQKKTHIPRAVSCTNISSALEKRVPPSRIPVKTNLHKTFPSTPSNLNSDWALRCTLVDFDNIDEDEPLSMADLPARKSASMQNLLRASQQVQNVSKFGRLSQVKREHELHASKRYASSQDLQKCEQRNYAVTRKSQVMSASAGKSNDGKGGIIQNLAKTKRTICEKNKTVANNQKISATQKACGVSTVLDKNAKGNNVEKSNPGRNYTKPNVTGRSKTTGCGSSNHKDLDTAKVKVEKSPSCNTEARKDTASDMVYRESKLITKTTPSTTVVDRYTRKMSDLQNVKCPSSVDVSNAAKPQQIEEADKEHTEDNFKNDTFGSMKRNFEPKFAEKARPLLKSKPKPKTKSNQVTLKRSENARNDRVREFEQLEKLEQNLKTAKQLFVSTSLTSCEIISSYCVRANCEQKIESFMDILKGNQVLVPDVRNDGKIHRNLLKRCDFNVYNFGEIDHKSETMATKTLGDYVSDDNSDDSGNISNENELEFDDRRAIPFERIFSSSESLDRAVKDVGVGDGATDSNFAQEPNEEVRTITVYSTLHSFRSFCVITSNKLLRVKRECLLQVFFRSGVLSELESQRDERLVGMTINLQAHCRGFLARRKLSQRKLQDLAVRCIQRNVRKFLLVRDWPWWRLLIRVTPLLNVHRTEEELKLKTVSTSVTVVFTVGNVLVTYYRCLNFLRV